MNYNNPTPLSAKQIHRFHHWLVEYQPQSKHHLPQVHDIISHWQNIIHDILIPRIDITLSLDSEYAWQWQQWQQSTAFIAAAQEACRRDMGTCQCCGFQAKRHMYAIHYNMSEPHLDPDSLMTICPFCAQVKLFPICEALGGGTVIMLPEIPQNTLNVLTHILLCSIINQTTEAATASEHYHQILYYGGNYLDTLLFEQASDAPLFVEYALTQRRRFERDPEILKSLRIIPDINRFMPILEDWSQDSLTELMEGQLENTPFS